MVKPDLRHTCIAAHELRACGQVRKPRIDTARRRRAKRKPCKRGVDIRGAERTDGVDTGDHPAEWQQVRRGKRDAGRIPGSGTSRTMKRRAGRREQGWLRRIVSTA